MDTAESMKRWSVKSIRDHIMHLIKEGTTTEKLALTCTLGLIISIFPLFGTTTLLCFGVALALRLNVVLIQLVNYIAAPLQIILIFPFFQLGGNIFGVQGFSYTKDQLLAEITADFWAFAGKSTHAIAASVGAWTIAAIPLSIVVYLACHLLIRKLKQRHGMPVARS